MEEPLEMAYKYFSLPLSTIHQLKTISYGKDFHFQRINLIGICSECYLYLTILKIYIACMLLRLFWILVAISMEQTTG